ncbi:hypothetical protein MHA_0815 [Mannheimia haemolytica PHL213]|nr:hypothetical protein MHA_0815 [Mannheimia haemolytica PHL213]
MILIVKYSEKDDKRSFFHYFLQYVGVKINGREVDFNKE